MSNVNTLPQANGLNRRRLQTRGGNASFRVAAQVASDQRKMSESKTNHTFNSKQDVEEILSKHGGNYQPDFGLNNSNSLNFAAPQRGSVWSKLFNNISGNQKDQKMQKIIQQINTEKVRLLDYREDAVFSISTFPYISLFSGLENLRNFL